VYIYGDRGGKIHLRVGRMYILRERGGVIHLRVGRVYTLREGKRHTLES
jgi:hypothetical protein